MKRCCKCKELKPESEFYKNKYALDGLRYSCKDCDYKVVYKRRGYTHKIKHKPRRPSFDDYLGGYTITIQNYVKKGEYKFNILPTKGKVFKTNDADLFFLKLRGLLND